MNTEQEPNSSADEITTTPYPLGNRWHSECMICEEKFDEWGDMNNPTSHKQAESICTDCRQKIKTLIGK